MFLSKILGFLLRLRDEYGFIISVDRLSQCLTCAENITDLNEVFYRMRALTCKTEEDTETFRQVFGQELLGMRMDVAINARDQEKKKAERCLTNEVKRMEALDAEEKRLLESLKRMQEEVHKAESHINGIRAETPISENDLESMAAEAKPAVENEKLRLAHKKFNEEMERAAKVFPDEVSSDLADIQSKIEASLSLPDGRNEMKAGIASLLDLSVRLRRLGDMNAFSACVALASSANALYAAAEKATNKSKRAEYTKKVRENETHYERLDAAERTLHDAREKTEKLETRLESIVHNRKVAEREYRQANDAYQMIEKAASANHREIFLPGGNAVQTVEEVKALMDTNIKSMSRTEKDLILSYIRSNARVFRQRLRRKKIAPQKRIVDIKETIRYSVRTDGEIAMPRYKKPVKSHASVVCMVDISGSCKNASTLALYFMAMMNDAFPGGCHKFAFVNQLNPVDSMFRDRSADEGVEKVFQSIPTRGVYSDYGRPLRELKEGYMGCIRRDTTVVILGDARTNNYASGADVLKYISDRCRQVFFLETEPEAEWNRGDSVIQEYQEAGAIAFHVETVGDVLRFLSNGICL